MAWSRTATVVAATLACLLSGCGGGSTPPVAVAGRTAPPTLRPASPSSLDSGSPTPDPSATPAPQQPMAPVMQALSFPVQPVDQPLAGMVTVEPHDGSYTVSIQVSGMRPGSMHGVHLHFGTCPSTGVHQLVVGTLRAGPGGAAVLVSTVNRTYMGDGQFVVIYVGPNAGPLAGCAQLAGRP